MLISGSIFLFKNYINSVTHSKYSVDETHFLPTENTRFIYSQNGHKLYADFIFGENHENVAVLYIGYGFHKTLAQKLKEFYIKKGFSVVLICAEGFSVSGRKKADDFILSKELSNWLDVIKSTFGEKVKIFLHGFSYTALSVLNCSNLCFAVFADNTHLFPVYNYKNIKNRILKSICKKKSRAEIPEIAVPVFLSSEKGLSKETYKLYEISSSEKSVYIYDNFDADEYIKRLNGFIIRLTPPEE